MTPVRRLVMAELTSEIGSSLTLFAVPVAVFIRTRSPATTGVVASLVTLGTVLGAVAAPRVIALAGCRWSMLFSDGLAAVVSVGLFFASITSTANVWVLAVGVFVLGFIRNSFVSAQQIVLGQIVTGDELAAAYGQVMAATRIATILGPIVAGASLTGPGLWPLFAADAVSFMVSAVLVLTVTRSVTAPVGSGSRSTLSALKFIARSPLLRWWTSAAAVTEVAWQVLFLSVPVIAVLNWSSPIEAGVIFAGFSGGSLLGSVGVGPAARRYGRVRVATVARAVVPITFIAMAALQRNFVAFLVAVSIGGLVNGIANPGLAAIVRESIPMHDLAGVLSVRYSLNLTGGMIGRAGGGFLINAVNVAPALVIAAIMQGVGWLLFRTGTSQTDLRPHVRNG